MTPPLSSVAELPSASRCCDECGRSISKAHRVEDGVSYCGTCYARCFKPRPCGQCGLLSRLLVSDASASCRKCQHGGPCTRCGKTGAALGKISAYGPICASCRPHFVQEKACSNCGTVSTRLSRAQHLGFDEPVCPACARLDHATCSSCRRYRRVSASPNGQMLCVKCLDLGTVPCPSCTQPMPAGSGRQCDTCSWRLRLHRRCTQDVHAIASPKGQRAFLAFAQWLELHQGPKRAALGIHRQLEFFLRLDEHWQSGVDAGTLLRVLGSVGMRRHLLATRWLSLQQGVEIDEQGRQTDTEERLTQALLATLPGQSMAFQAASAYREKLKVNGRRRQPSPRSIRLALRPAVTLLLESDPKGTALPAQQHLIRYLHRVPGQRAALSGFISFLRAERGLELTMPTTTLRPADLKGIERELVALYRERSTSSAWQRRWIFLALQFFHRLDKKRAQMASQQPWREEPQGFVVACDGLEYWLPRPGA